MSRPIEAATGFIRRLNDIRKSEVIKYKYASNSYGIKVAKLNIQATGKTGEQLAREGAKEHSDPDIVSWHVLADKELPFQKGARIIGRTLKIQAINYQGSAVYFDSLGNADHAWDLRKKAKMYSREVNQLLKPYRKPGLEERYQRRFWKVEKK